MYLTQASIIQNGITGVTDRNMGWKDYTELIYVNVMALTWICQFPFQEEVMKWLSGSIDWQDYVVSVQVAYISLTWNHWDHMTINHAVDL